MKLLVLNFNSKFDIKRVRINTKFRQSQSNQKFMVPGGLSNSMNMNIIMIMIVMIITFTFDFEFVCLKFSYFQFNYF